MDTPTEHVRQQMLALQPAMHLNPQKWEQPFQTAWQPQFCAATGSPESDRAGNRALWVDTMSRWPHIAAADGNCLRNIQKWAVESALGVFTSNYRGVETRNMDRSWHDRTKYQAWAPAEKAETPNATARAGVKFALGQGGMRITDRRDPDELDIDLSTDENCLLREELADICKPGANSELHSHHSSAQGFAGEPTLLGSLAKLFNNYFNPCVPVRPHHIVAGSGTNSCLVTLLYKICDPEDGVLVPGPYWNGDEVDFRTCSSVQSVLVKTEKFTDIFTLNLIPKMEEAMDNATCRIRALVLTNPHNLFGQCYPQEVLEACLKFCQRREIHMVSDEVYAMTTFSCAEISDPTPFISVLSLDAGALQCDRSRIHMIWGTSKDFGVSGCRMGCIVSQDNRESIVGLAASPKAQVSSPSVLSTTALLSSPTLPLLVALNSARLAESYILITSFFIRHRIDYIPVNAGLNIFARLVPNAKTCEDELDMITTLKENGVVVRGGGSYHGTLFEKGWVRISFALEEHRLQEALHRIETALHLES
ncbi:SirI protein [Blastomyces gilchristii SLH14081]|uniref:SirI protein n=1 Tax=Blastomyces gilchristii (strain SLH14081) TaxID=559298 RepID=A0A179UAN4_BLAGS|nr:SirI protein [Blastomyces gilchristii SLH14081]OAT04900.1 SirI protein [Blastomyces gilchristii SLH14081]